MTPRGAVRAFAGLTVVYLAALWWSEARSGEWPSVRSSWQVLPVLLAWSCASFVARYSRWHWLVARAGHRVRWQAGAQAYFAGFAFTASPGKLGELVRVRYFAWQGVPAEVVVGAFVFERAFDLLVVLTLACAYAGSPPALGAAALFVAAIVGAVAVLVARPGWPHQVADRLRARGWRRPARALRITADGLRACRQWFTAADVAVSLAAGLLAWGCQAASFLAVVDALGIRLPLATALGLYPLAMLAGAAS
jgi:hypothetical protein